MKQDSNKINPVYKSDKKSILKESIEKVGVSNQMYPKTRQIQKRRYFFPHKATIKNKTIYHRF